MLMHSIRGSDNTRAKKHVVRSKRGLKKVEKLIRGTNKNDKVVFPSDRLEYLNFKHSHLEECKELERELPATFPSVREYEIDEIQKPVFQNPAVEKYQKESMRETLNRYRNHDNKWENLTE